MNNRRFTVPVPSSTPVKPDRPDIIPPPPPVSVPPQQSSPPPSYQQTENTQSEDKEPRRFDWLLITAVAVLFIGFFAFGITAFVSSGSHKGNEASPAPASSTSPKTPSPSGNKTTPYRPPSSFLSRALGTMLSILLLVAFVLILCVIGTILSYFKSGQVQVKGYRRKDGTYVKSHTRKR